MGSYNPTHAQQCTRALNVALQHAPPPHPVPQYIIQHPIYLPQPVQLIAFYYQPIYAMPPQVDLVTAPTHLSQYGPGLIMQHRPPILYESSDQTPYITQSHNTVFNQRAPPMGHDQIRYTLECELNYLPTALPNQQYPLQHHTSSPSLDQLQCMRPGRITAIAEGGVEFTAQQALKPSSKLNHYRKLRGRAKPKTTMNSSTKRAFSPYPDGASNDRGGKKVKLEQG